jgi:hypothetical protein
MKVNTARPVRRSLVSRAVPQRLLRLGHNAAAMKISVVLSVVLVQTLKPADKGRLEHARQSLTGVSRFGRAQPLSDVLAQSRL